MKGFFVAERADNVEDRVQAGEYNCHDHGLAELRVDG